MKRIAILMVVALLVEPALAQGTRGGSFAASPGRSVAGYAGGSVAGYTGASTARHGPVGQHGHHNGHHRPPVAVVFPWWWPYHYGYRPYYSSTVVVTAPVYVPVYTPVPASIEPGAPLRYYCPDYRDYYPNVATCPSQWLQVVPDAASTGY